MKLLFDQNLSPKLAEFFKASFDNTVDVQDIGIGAADVVFAGIY